jgi:hypothetical protein
MVRQPRFPDDFKNASGMGLQDYVDKFGEPGPALMASMGGSLNADQGNKLAAALRATEAQLAMEANGSYIGGGRAKSGGESSDKEFGDMMAGIMSKFGAKPEDGEHPSESFKQVIFANHNRPPEAIADDRKLNLFDRVTFRYHWIVPRLMDPAEQRRQP